MRPSCPHRHPVATSNSDPTRLSGHYCATTDGSSSGSSARSTAIPHPPSKAQLNIMINLSYGIEARPRVDLRSLSILRYWLRCGSDAAPMRLRCGSDGRGSRQIRIVRTVHQRIRSYRCGRGGGTARFGRRSRPVCVNEGAASLSAAGDRGFRWGCACVGELRKAF
jgi:hypothetical protein